MDIVAHGLWAWAGGEVLRRHGYLSHHALVAGVALAIVPDLIQMAPVLARTLLGQVSLGKSASRSCIATSCPKTNRAPRLG